MWVERFKATRIGSVEGDEKESRSHFHSSHQLHHPPHWSPKRSPRRDGASEWLASPPNCQNGKGSRSRALLNLYPGLRCNLLG